MRVTSQKVQLERSLSSEGVPKGQLQRQDRRMQRQKETLTFLKYQESKLAKQQQQAFY